VIHSFLGVSIIEARGCFFNRLAGIISCKEKPVFSPPFSLRKSLLALVLQSPKRVAKRLKDKGRKEEIPLFVVRW
jgi:hypothetical protein